MHNDVIRNHDQLYKIFGMNIEVATPEYSRVTMPLSPQANNLNGMGFAHGGAIYALADIAFGVASNCEESTGTVTLSSSIQFLETGRGGPLVGEATLIRGGRHVVTYNVTIHDAAGTLVATATFQGYRTENAFIK